MDHKGFWDSLSTTYIEGKENVIVGGDMNFILRISELWGGDGKMYPLAPSSKN